MISLSGQTGPLSYYSQLVVDFCELHGLDTGQGDLQCIRLLVWTACLCVALVRLAETASGGLLNLPAVFIHTFVLGKIGCGAQENA
jgi:hypothetical protein